MYTEIDSYTPAGSSYDEFYCGTEDKQSDLSRSPLGVNINTYPMTTIEFEQMPSVFPFPPCTPTIKEFSVFKEKSQDIADALLSLKNAVVRPGYSGQLSPISPTMHLGHGNGNCPSQSTVTYHNGPFHHTGVYPPQNSGQFTVQQYPGNDSQQNNMFPSMSVNVSMSMNVGVPHNMGNNQYSVQQWSSNPPPTRPTTPPPPYQYNQYSLPPVSPQYNTPSAHQYPNHYSISHEMRPFSSPETRNFIYRPTDNYKEAARLCAVSQWKRAKFLGNRHGNIQCESSKVNLCRICGKTYARPSTLKTHLRTHSGEKPYKCSTCSKSFSQAANLTAHSRTHSGEKPFHCPMCDRRFSQSSSVTTHMRTHSGERPYRCRLCKKAFSDSSTLTKHLRIHSGEKPYQCKLCLLRFSQSGNLNRHMRVHTTNV
ncbi:protein glass-like [Saccostrea cucullata]|uniref:protein glass-like n=1 Tax=Saccostrea cuccullata TaxID=36930 RepID=UPI002ED34BA0